MFKGTVIAQIIAVVSSLFVAKIYGSEAYGILSIFIGFSSIFSILNTLQLDNYIITSKNKIIRTNWFNFLFLLIPFTTFIIALIFFPIIIYFPEKNIDQNIFILVILSAIFLSYNKTHEYFLTTLKNFSAISFAKILLVLINVSLQFILYSKFKVNGLIYSSFLSLLLVTFFFSYKNIKHFKSVDFYNIRNNIEPNKSILKYLLPSRFINNLSSQSIPIIIFAFFSIQEAGIYFFSYKILTTPLFIISSSISSVYFERAARLVDSSKKELYNETLKIIIFNVTTILIFLILLNTIGIYILEYILTENWDNLRIYTLILSFLILCRSSFSSISNIIVVLNKNQISLLFNIYLLIVNISALYIGYVKNDLIYSIYIVSFLGGIGYLTLVFYFLKTIKKNQLHE